MQKKYCGKCNDFSYSARTEGQWVCPTCGKDLTDKRAYGLGLMDRYEGIKSGLTVLKPEA